MARSRNIKPGFFKNDLLAEVDPLGRLLFAGLWTIADREGRLEYRSKRIKAEILPYDNCDIKHLLTQLIENGFLKPYSANGKDYIEISNFNKHQNPHHKEPPSEIPAPTKTETSPGQVRDKTGSDRADSGFLIPDSFNLIPDSGNPKIPPAPYEEIKELFHQICQSYKPIAKITDNRKKHIAARWKEYAYDLDRFKTLFEKAEASEFLKGNNDRQWQAEFDWLIKPDNMAKVIEGRYDELKTEKKKKTDFHLGESRGKEYTNEELEKLLLKKG